jgi:SOUL heme-binding protein
MWWVIGGIVLLTGVLSGTILSNVEQPKYEVVAAENNIEVRNYSSMIVAEVEVSGDRDVAIQEGFRLIADYIFGNNSSGQKVAMTSPVTQQAGEKIAMTAPVTHQGDGGGWRVRFVMPDTYTLETLPKPNNVAVMLKKISGGQRAVIRFSGLAEKESLARYTEKLGQFMISKGLKSASTPTYAFYNPPWTLPFLRRNEVMVELTDPEIQNN